MNTSSESKKMIRVLILADVPLWLLPGGEKFYQAGAYSSWLEALFPYFGQHSGISVEWAVFSKSTRELETVEIHGQRVYVLPRWKKSISMFSRYFLDSYRIKRLVRRVKPDIIHAWGTEDAYGITGARLDVPKVFSLQGSLSDYLKKIGGSFLFRLQASYEASTVRAYEYATAESQLARELILEHNPSCNVKLVDYGVHPSFFDIKWDPCEEPSMLFIGSLDKRKGTHQLIDAFKDEALSHVRLVIVGAGPLEEELKAKASSNVEWRGRLSRADIQHELSQSWGLVMPTFADTGPTVLKEARVVGLPVITTHDAGAKSYLVDGENGSVISSGDVQAIIQSVLAITQSRDKCLAMGAVNWESTREELHPARSIEKFVDVYRNILNLPK
tara:strand:+ start:335 stop:1495 length:1161 start_codon:yes stop_codon:yes gene_type:complete